MGTGPVAQRPLRGSPSDPLFISLVWGQRAVPRRCTWPAWAASPPQPSGREALSSCSFIPKGSLAVFPHADSCCEGFSSGVAGTQRRSKSQASASEAHVMPPAPSLPFCLGVPLLMNQFAPQTEPCNEGSEPHL